MHALCVVINYFVALSKVQRLFTRSMDVCTYRTLNTDVNFIVTYHAVTLRSKDNKINISDVINIPESEGYDTFENSVRDFKSP